MRATGTEYLTHEAAVATVAVLRVQIAKLSAAARECLELDNTERLRAVLDEIEGKPELDNLRGREET